MLPERMQHNPDVNMLLGNLLENAIETAVQTQQKYLKVDIALKRGVLKIGIENSFLPGELEVRERRGNSVFLSLKRWRGSMASDWRASGGLWKRMTEPWRQDFGTGCFVWT